MVMVWLMHQFPRFTVSIGGSFAQATMGCRTRLLAAPVVDVAQCHVSPSWVDYKQQPSLATVRKDDWQLEAKR